MLLDLSWTEIAIRLGCALLAGSLIGIERGEQGRAAGLRTILLVCVAATTTMLLANLLMIQAALRPDVFRTFDVLRLPLGLLSGMGFIGAGAILHRKELIVGVTTAATLWFVTIAGLCFGSGQLALGAVTTVLSLVILRGLHWAEDLIPRDRQAMLELQLSAESPSEESIRVRFAAHGLRSAPRGVRYQAESGSHCFTYEVTWRARRTETAMPPILAELAALPGVASVEWKETPAG